MMPFIRGTEKMQTHNGQFSQVVAGGSSNKKPLVIGLPSDSCYFHQHSHSHLRISHHFVFYPNAILSQTS